MKRVGAVRIFLVAGFAALILFLLAMLIGVMVT